MVAALFDSSAIARRYIRGETNAERVLRFLRDPDNAPSVAALAMVEVPAILARRRREGTLPAGEASRLRAEFEYHLRAEYEVIDLERPLLGLAARLVDRQAIRSLDAVHVAAALALSQTLVDPVQFWTADRRQGEAARAEGLDVVLLSAER